MLAARISYFSILLLFPFYLLSTGGFQISTVALVATFLLVAVYGWRHFFSGRAVNTHLLFVLYAVSVNLSWYYISNNDEFLLYTAYLLLTGIMYFCSVIIGRAMSAQDAHLLVILLFGSVVFQLFIVIVGLGGELAARQVAFFNDPNQLAYYVAACSGIVLLLSHLYKIQSKLVLLTCLVALLVSVFTASRVGVAACLIYLFIAIFISSSLKGWSRAMAVIVLFTGVLMSYEPFMSTPTFEAVNNRVAAASDVQETALQPGYDRILMYSDNRLLGVGEGVFERFGADSELNSYFATLLFSYGVIGFVLFLWFLRSSVPDWRCLVLLMPLFVYNLTQHGGRSLMFWAMLGLMAAATLPAIGHSPVSIKKKRRRRHGTRRSSSEVDIVL